MPKDFINVDPNLTPGALIYGNKLRSTVSALRSVMNQLDELYDMMSHNFVNQDFTQIEAKCGLAAGATPSNGQTVFDLVNGTLLALKGQGQNSNAISLIERVG